jgi:hypothetical protein
LPIAGLVAYRMDYSFDSWINVILGAAIFLYLVTFFFFGLIVPPVYIKVNGKSADERMTMFPRNAASRSKKTPSDEK